MGRRHIFRLVQLNASCIDFAPTFQKQKVERCIKNKSRQEGLVNQKYLRHILCFVAPIVSEEPLLLRGCSEMGIHLGCPWQEVCACAFCRCHAAQSSSHVTCAAEKAQGGGKLLCFVLQGLLSQRYHCLRRVRGSVSLCALPWTS